MQFLIELKEFYNMLKKDKRNIFEIPYTTMNIGKIDGGNSINIVPNNCEVLIDFRVVDNRHTDLILNKINELIKKYNAKCEIINNVQAFINRKDKIYTTNFITEESFIEAKNKMLLGVGPVNPHQANEYIETQSLDKLVLQYKDIINKYCYKR